MAADALDLIFAGHTHGGQIRLPMWERMHLFGWIPQLPVYVSRGLGVTAWPLRCSSVASGVPPCEAM